MVLARAVCLLLVALLSAGCSQPAAPAPSPSPSMAPSSTGPAPAAAVATPHHVDLGWSGQIPYGAWVCEVHLPPCRAVPSDGAYGVNHDAAGAGIVLGGNLTLTWTAASPLTQRMAIGLVAIVPGCADCNETHLGKDLDGPSPLVYPIPAGQVVAPGSQLRIWVYSADYHPVGPEYAGTSGQQDFQVEGGIDLAS